MSNETILQRALNVLMGKEETAPIETAPVSVDLAEKKTIDGTAIFDSENFAIGEAVFLIAEDGTQIPVPMGEYQLEDGTSIVVDESGIIVEVATGEETEEVEAMMPEDMQNQPMKEQIKKASEMTPAAAKKVVKIKSESEESYFSKIEARLSRIENESENLKSINLKLSEENEALKKAMAETPAQYTKFNPDAETERTMKFKIGARREETIADRVMNALS
jgi:hypothetical protein